MEKMLLNGCLSVLAESWSIICVFVLLCLVCEHLITGGPKLMSLAVGFHLSFRYISSEFPVAIGASHIVQLTVTNDNFLTGK